MNATGVVLRGEPRAFHITSDPQTFLACAPWGVGLRCAVVYRARGHDVCGWWVGAVGAEYRFGRLNHLDKREPTWTHLSAQADVHVINRLMRGWPLDCRTLSVR